MSDEFCDLCGRNLTAMGMYRDFVHYRADTKVLGTPCLPDSFSVISPEIIALANEMTQRLIDTVQKMDTK